MVLMSLISDVPEEVNIQLKRRDFIQRKLIDRVPDEDSEGEEAINKIDVHDAFQSLTRLETYPR